ncbi:MAG: MFS transporter [Deltaproteobacteria bacterium]|jgi:MFS family permease|nr:MFS transporter [Deltaproteobacteria bacterium]
MNVLFKSILCMIILLLFVTGLLFMLSSFKFQTVLTNLIANRLSATSPAIYESIEGAIDLGLGLGEIQNTGKVISWVQQNNPGIQSIDIFNIKGTVLYSTDIQHVEQAVAPYIFENFNTTAGHSSQMEHADNFISTFKLLNNYDQRVGGGSIVYAKDDYTRQVIEFKSSLWMKSILIFIAFAILAALGIMAAFRGLKNYLSSIETSHIKIRESEAAGQNVCFIDVDGLPAAASENALIRMEAVDDRLCAIEKNIADATRALDALEMTEPEGHHDRTESQEDVSYDQQSELASQMARPLIFIMMGALFLSSIIFAYTSYSEFTRFLEPEFQKKGQLIALNINRDLAKAVEVGIPFEEMVGVGEYLDSIAAEFDEVNYLAVEDPTGQTRYQGGQAISGESNLDSSKPTHDTESRAVAVPNQSKSIIYRYPMKMGDETNGFIQVGIDEDFVRSQLDSIIYDNIVIFIVAVLVAFQIMTALFLFYVTGPIERLNMLINLQVRGNFSNYIKTRAGDSVGKVVRYLSLSAQQLNDHFRARRDQLKAASGEILRRLDDIGKRYGLSQTESPRPLIRASVSDIRIPLFLFAFAEELQKSFLPIFVRQLYEPNPWLSESVIISLPIVVWLTIVGLAAPFSGQWSKRFGSRNIFLFGLIPSVAGFLGCSMAQTIFQFVLWRGATALGYAMITIACQDYLLGKNVAGSRNVNIAVFIGIVITATMCGTAIGGILAARIGYQATFLIAAGLMILAGFAGYQMLSLDIGTGIEVTPTGKGGLAGIRLIFKNRRFLVFLFCIAIPTNILMAAYLWYLVPLYLFELDRTTAEIGRTMMIYYLLIIAIGEAVSKKVNTAKGLTLLVGLGALLSGIGLVAFHRWYDFWAVALSVAFLGLSHALIKAPQITLSLEICRAEVQTAGHNIVLGALRVLERFGSIVGLITGAVMIDHYGYQKTTGIAGISVCVASLFFLLFFFVFRKNKPDA